MTDDRPSLVVRGGTVRKAEHVREKIEYAIEEDGIAVVSVYVDQIGEHESERETLERICREVGRDGGLPHNQVQVAYLDCLTEAGLVVRHEVADGESGYHHHVHFSQPVTDYSVRQFIDCFTEPMPNPAREGTA